MAASSPVATDPLPTTAGVVPLPVGSPGELPASGVKVLGLTRVIAGPVGTRMLGALGADVLRVDHPARPELALHGIDGVIGKASTTPPGQGVGRALVEATVDLARAQYLRRVWCTATNDNLAALGFWQALGFVLVELRPGAVETARRLKPSIPLHGYLGLPIRDEIDLGRTL